MKPLLTAAFFVPFLLASFTGQASDIDRLKAEALAGNGKAALKLAKAYEDGKVPDLSTGAAEDMYRFAFIALSAEAEAGKSSSMLKLAQLYGQGKGTKASTRKALEWLEKALAKQSSKAQLTAGEMALWGDLPGYHPADGLVLLQRATQKADTADDAWYLLGMAYATGIAGLVDKSAARKAFQAAKAAGHQQAGIALRYLEGVSSHGSDTP